MAYTRLPMPAPYGPLQCRMINPAPLSRSMNRVLQSLLLLHMTAGRPN
jgi:hypothetical protein